VGGLGYWLGQVMIGLGALLLVVVVGVLIIMVVVFFLNGPAVTG
jgi:hypothetical protein